MKIFISWWTSFNGFPGFNGECFEIWVQFRSFDVCLKFDVPFHSPRALIHWPISLISLFFVLGIVVNVVLTRSSWLLSASVARQRLVAVPCLVNCLCWSGLWFAWVPNCLSKVWLNELSFTATLSRARIGRAAESSHCSLSIHLQPLTTTTRLSGFIEYLYLVYSCRNGSIEGVIQAHAGNRHSYSGGPVLLPQYGLYVSI